MTELLTAAQMRTVEKTAIAAGEVTGLELMERAGRGVVEAVFDEWPEFSSGERKALVLCGPGNNGGDGYVVARLLHDRGWHVDVLAFGDISELPLDALANCEKWRALGSIIPTEEHEFGLRDYVQQNKEPDLFVDALFGTGLTRPVPEHLRYNYLQVLAGATAGSETWYPRTDCALVAIDMPSGLCADSGRILMPQDPNFSQQTEPGAELAGLPDLTVTFHSEKRGHYLAKGPSACGKLVCKDIGLSHSPTKARSNEALVMVNPAKTYSILTVPRRDIDRVFKSLPRQTFGKNDANKYSHGHALVLTGGSGKSGAARLAGRAALRIGAGLVTYGVPGSAHSEVACQITSEMMLHADTGADLADILTDERISGVCLGPGSGIERAKELVPVALEGVKPRPTVLDADALTAFAESPETLFKMLHKKCVLTPHGGEFARLFPDIAEKLREFPTNGPAYSKVDATQEAAKLAGCVVLYKGPDTVIAHPYMGCSIISAHYDRAAPWLATAGTGDVLAGFITGLLARGFDPMQAAETGAWLHVECARAFGSGLIAEDLPEVLPEVFRALGV